MKKVFGLFVIAASLTACDNGDMVFENLNFEGKEIQKCQDNELHFKINSNELLLVDFTDNRNNTTTSWLNREAELDKVFYLNTDDAKIYYRTYDAPISNNTICSLFAPANPKVTSEYTSVSGGKIHYTRTMAPVVKDGIVTVTYAFTINFENITLTNGTNEIKYTTYPFGTYIYDTSKISLDYNNNFVLCEEGNTLVGNKTIELLKLKLADDFVFPKTETTQTIHLSTENNLKTFVYDKNLSSGLNFCEPIDKEKYKVKEEWTATEGTLIIQSKLGATGYRHSLKIENAKFTNGKNSFIITDKNMGIYDPGA